MAEIEVVEAAAGEARAALEALGGAGAVERQLERPRARPGYALLARDGTATAGYALLAHTRYRLGAATIETLELTALAAGGAAAREALLGAALSAAVAAGLPFLSLRRAPAAFAGYGLAPCAYLAHLTLPRLPASPQAEAQAGIGGLRPAAADDLDDLAALHSAAYAALPLSPLRAAPDWRWLLGSGAQLLIQEDKRGRVVGYAQLGQGAGSLVVREAAAADGGAARALLQALTQQAEAAGSSLALELSPGHSVARAALQLGAELVLRAPGPNQTARLWGVVDLAATLDALQPELEARLAGSRYAGWSGRVAIEAASGLAALAWESGRASLARPDLPPDVAIRRASLGGLAQLLLGYRDTGDLRATGELAAVDVDLGLLDALFPALMPVE